MRYLSSSALKVMTFFSQRPLEKSKNLHYRQHSIGGKGNRNGSAGIEV
jgi:hypothetical protein